METAVAKSTLPCLVTPPFALGLLLDGLPEDSIPALAATNPDVLRSCLHFLIAPRTPQQMKHLFDIGLAQNSLPCSCDKNNIFISDLHCVDVRIPAPAYRAEDVGIAALLRSIISVLARAIELIPCPSGCFRAVQDAALCGKPAPWPACPDDLVPGGFDACLSALCAWVPYFPRDCLFDLISQYNHLLAPTRIETIVPAIVPCAYVSVLTHVLDVLEGGNIAYWEDLKLVNCALPSLLSYDESEIAAALARGNAKTQGEQFIEVCKRAILVIGDLETKKKISMEDVEPVGQLFMLHFGRFHSLLDLPVPKGSYPYLRQYADDFARHRATNRNNVLADLASTFYHGYLHYCWNPNCSRTDWTEFRLLKRCAGCRHVYYCSRACQRASWRDRAMPHKEGCARIRDLTQLLTPSRTKHGQKVFEEGCARAPELVEYAIEALRHMKASA